MQSSKRHRDLKDLKDLKMIKKALLILLLLTLVLASLAGVVIWSLWQPVDSSAGEKEIVVPKGASVVRIANLLHSENLIKHPLVFRITAKALDMETKLQAGTFKVSPSMTPQELTIRLTQGTEDTWITILEGWRREEIADYLSDQPLSDFDHAEFLSQSATLEGMLFPETYLVPKEISTTDLVSLLNNTFKTRVTAGLDEQIDASELTFNQILTLASLVEREARGYEQMRLVAGILYNRLEIGMPLQVDATLQYLKGYDEKSKSWWVPPLAVDKSLDSPYNTYQAVGLPPGPIANPSLDAIKATLDPMQVDDLFYIHAPDGSIHSAQTLEEHNANVNRYLR